MAQVSGSAIDNATAPAEAGGLRALVVTSPEAFRSLRAELDTLCDELCEENVFYEPWLIDPALTHLGGKGALRFVCFYETGKAGRLCGFFPLMLAPLHRLLPIPILQSWYHPHCFRCTPLIRTGFALACWSALLDWLEQQPARQRLLYLNRLASEGEVEQALQRLLGQHTRMRHSVVGYETAFLRIDRSRPTDSKTVLRQVMSRRTLGKLGRQQRRLSERGQLVFAEADEAPDLTPLVDDFLQLEASGWKGQSGTALACHASDEAFFRAVTGQARERGRLTFLTLRLDGKLVAAQTCLIGRDGAFLFKVAYNESYAKYSPGILLEIEHLRRVLAPEDRLLGKLRWADSCADPDDGPVYRCWPGRRTIRDYRIAGRLSPLMLVVVLWPLLRSAYHRLQHRKANIWRGRKAAAPPAETE
jgi:CelD/BcsL family acetyltransferase involved in cellulose biosynthesis